MVYFAFSSVLSNVIHETPELLKLILFLDIMSLTFLTFAGFMLPQETPSFASGTPDVYEAKSSL